MLIRRKDQNSLLSRCRDNSFAKFVLSVPTFKGPVFHCRIEKGKSRFQNQVHRKGPTKFEVSTTTFRLFVLMDQKAKRWITILAMVINSDYYGELELLLYNADRQEYVPYQWDAHNGSSLDYAYLYWLLLLPCFTLLVPSCISLKLYPLKKNSNTESLALGSTFRKTQAQAAVTLIGSNVPVALREHIHQTFYIFHFT